MNILLGTNDDGSKYFEIENERLGFNYESFDILIRKTYDNDDEIVFKSEDGCENYEALISEIIDNCRTEDFRTAAQRVDTLTSELQTEEARLETEMQQEEPESDT